MSFECKIAPMLLEKSLKQAFGGEVFTPTSSEGLSVFLVKSFKRLEEEIFLLNPEILENFTLIGETKMGELKLASMAEKLKAIEIGTLSIKELKEKIINAVTAECDLTPILKDESIVFVSKNGEVKKTLKPSFESVKLGEFIVLRQEFFIRLKSFSLSDEHFLKKVLKLVEPAFSVKEFLKLFENEKGNLNLITYYAALFYIVEGFGMVKKKWIF